MREQSLNRCIRRLCHVMRKHMPGFFHLAATIVSGQLFASSSAADGGGGGADNAAARQAMANRLQSMLGVLGGEAPPPRAFAPVSTTSAISGGTTTPMHAFFTSSTLSAEEEEQAAAQAAQFQLRTANAKALIATINSKFASYVRAAMGMIGGGGAAAAPASGGGVVVGYRELSGLTHDNVHSVLRTIDTLRARAVGVVTPDTVQELQPVLCDEVVRHFTAQVWRNALVSVHALSAEEKWMTASTSHSPGITRLPEMCVPNPPSFFLFFSPPFFFSST